MGAAWVEPVVGMRFRFAGKSTFTMGDEGGDENSAKHTVTLSRRFWIGETEVTQDQWTSLMGTNPTDFPRCGGTCPIDSVGWKGALKFANALSRKSGLQECYGTNRSPVTFVGLDCEGYRLPTEAEWEYAARAGGNNPYSGSSNPSDVAWWVGISNHRTHPVGQKTANNWGLYDMTGNVWEWCWDWYAAYPNVHATDPTGPPTGDFKVRRGGGYSSDAGSCRVEVRDPEVPGGGSASSGFRLVVTAQ